MMRFKRWIFGAMTILLAATAMLGTSPSEASAQDACWDCGAYRGAECKRTEACVWGLWARICTTTTLRYPAMQ